MTSKRYLQLKQVAEHADCPWSSVQEVRGAYYRAQPRADTSDNITDPGDPALLRCFVQLAKGGPLLVDMVALAEEMEHRRVGTGEAA